MPEEQTTTAPVSPTPASPAQATPEPSSTPASTQGAPSDGTTGNVFDGFDFSNMDFADETGDTVKVDNTKTEQGKPEAPVQSAPVQPTPAAQQPPAVTAPVQAAPVAQPTPQTPAPAQQQPAQAGAAGTEDPYLKAWNDNQTQLQSELEKYYAIDDATAEKFLESPKEVMPKLLARLHLAVMQNTYKTVLDRLPPLMTATAEAVKSHAASEDKFFAAWPAFKRDDPAQMSVLMQYGQLYRQQNPGASEADFTKFVGAAAAAHLGLKMPVGKGMNGKGKPTPYSPAANSSPASGSGEPAPSQFDDLFTATKGE